MDRLSCPVIFFQGDEDKIVPPNQAEIMVEALKAQRFELVNEVEAVAIATHTPILNSLDGL